jgi:hypothetical protein
MLSNGSIVICSTNPAIQPAKFVIIKQNYPLYGLVLECPNLVSPNHPIRPTSSTNNTN